MKEYIHHIKLNGTTQTVVLSEQKNPQALITGEMHFFNNESPVRIKDIVIKSGDVITFETEVKDEK